MFKIQQLPAFDSPTTRHGHAPVTGYEKRMRYDGKGMQLRGCPLETNAHIRSLSSLVIFRQMGPDILVTLVRRRSEETRLESLQRKQSNVLNQDGKDPSGVY